MQISGLLLRCLFQIRFRQPTLRRTVLKKRQALSERLFIFFQCVVRGKSHLCRSALVRLTCKYHVFIHCSALRGSNHSPGPCCPGVAFTQNADPRRLSKGNFPSECRGGSENSPPSAFFCFSLEMWGTVCYTGRKRQLCKTVALRMPEMERMSSGNTAFLRLFSLFPCDKTRICVP